MREIVCVGPNAIGRARSCQFYSAICFARALCSVISPWHHHVPKTPSRSTCVVLWGRIGWIMAAKHITLDFSQSSVYSFSTESSGDTESTLTELHTSDKWSYISRDTFVPDLGMLSGKAILAVGKVPIRLIEWCWNRHRRRVINRSFPNNEDSQIARLPEMYDQLINFSK
jgi:hypothetical protein